MPTRITVSLIYLGVLVLFAFLARRRTQSIEDYYVGGRSVPAALVALSFYATFVSTNSFIGHSAKSFVFGVSWMIVGVVLVALTVFSWLVIAPRFRDKAESLGSIVPSDLFRLHFRSPRAGALAGLIILFDSIFFLAAVFLGASEAMAALLGFPFGLSLAIIFVVQIAYTSVGGYLADVWSDSIQGIVLFVGAIALPVALVAGAGGFENVVTTLRSIDDARLAADGDTFSLMRFTTAAPLILITGIGLSGGLKLVADPRQLSRFYGLRDAASARRGTLLIVVMVAVTYFFLLPIGLLARVYDIPAELTARTDGIVPWLLADAAVVGPLLGAVILTALLAAAMSTIDSVLLVAGAALQRDVLPLVLPRRTPCEAGVRSARRIVVLFAILPLGLALLASQHVRLGLGIVELTVFAGALYASAFLPGLMGILFWKRASTTGAVLGMVGGGLSTALWRFVAMPLSDGLARFPEVFVGLVIGAGAFALGSLLRPDKAPSDGVTDGGL